MRKLNSKIESVLSLDKLTAINTVLRFGVEIEFSNAGGLRRPGEPDRDAITKRLRSEVDSDDLIARVANNLDSHGYSTTAMRNVAGWLYANSDHDDSTFADEYYPGGFDEYIAELVSEAIDDGEVEDDECEVEFEDLSGWEHCDDGTRGIEQEYKTEFANTYSNLKPLVDRLFNYASPCTVPRNGSCHVHVSFPGVSHTCERNSELHCCILFALSRLVPYFPAKLWDRLLDTDCIRYFDYKNPPTNKYSTVHIHSQGTWEFRLFGYMDNADDVMECIYIAGDAIIEGYRLYQAGARVPQPIWFREEFEEAMKNKRSLPLNGYIEEAGEYIIELPLLEQSNSLLNILAGGMIHPDALVDSEDNEEFEAMDINAEHYAKAISVPYGGTINTRAKMYIRDNFIACVLSDRIQPSFRGIRTYQVDCDNLPSSARLYVRNPFGVTEYADENSPLPSGVLTFEEAAIIYNTAAFC